MRVLFIFGTFCGDFSVRLDVILEPDTPERFAELGNLAESYGFGGVWTANIVTARDPFMNFLPLAGRSERISMGPVAVSPFELHPVKMANQLYSLHEASGGRGQIVVGGGGGAVIAMGLKPGRRSNHAGMVQGVRECIEILESVGADSLLDYQGQVFSIAGYKPDWANAEVSRPAIYIGASKPRMLEMAATCADGVMLSDVTLHRMPETMESLQRGFDAIGGRPQNFAVSNLFAWHVKDDRAAAVDEARRKLFVRGMLEPWYTEPFLGADDAAFINRQLPVFAKAYAQNSPDFPGVPDALVEKLVDELTFTGTPADTDKFVAEMLKFQEAGVTEFAIRLYDAPEESIRLLGERVLPALQS